MFKLINDRTIKKGTSLGEIKKRLRLEKKKILIKEIIKLYLFISYFSFLIAIGLAADYKIRLEIVTPNWIVLLVLISLPGFLYMITPTKDTSRYV